MDLSNCPRHHIRNYLLMCVTLFYTCSLQAQNAQARISLSIRNATLEEFVKRMENSTGFAFIYGEEVQLTRRITLEVRNRTINEILQKAFENEPVRFEISRKHILLQKRAMPQKTNSRKFTISGYVTDGVSSEILIGVNVLEKSQHTGTATNPFGFYTLTLPEGKADLAISYLGYNTLCCDFALHQDTVLNICLNTNNELEEVVVLSDKKEAGIQSTAMGAHDIPMTQIKNTPTLLGEADLLKTIQLMPGVQAGTEGFSGLYVRGGGPDQNLVLLDGIPVYNADHLMGVFSIFTPEAVKKVTFYKSSFPARYGGRLSSIVDVRTNDGDMHRYHGTVSVGTLTDKIHFEGPIWKGHTAFNFSARGTHTALLSDLLKTTDEYETNTFNYYFYDINAKLNHKFSDRSRLFLGYYHGKDHYHNDIYSDGTHGFVQETSYYQISKYKNDNQLNWGNTILSARWNYVFSNKLFSNTTIARNNYQMKMSSSMESQSYVNSKRMDAFQYDIDYRSGIRDYSARIDFDYTPMPTHHIKFGVEYLNHLFRPETSTSKVVEEQNGILQQDTLYSSNGGNQLRGHEISLYAEDNFDINSRLSLNAGMHLSLFHTQGKNYFSAQPRLSVRYRFNNGFLAKASYACMAQYVHLLSATPLSMPTDLWVPITKNIRPMYSSQYSLGGYYTGIAGWEFSIEGYYKQMRNVLEYKDGTTVFGTSTNWEEKVESGSGRSMGIEFMAQKTLGKTTGWITYTLAKSDRQFKNGSINNGVRFPYKYDRPHSVSIVLNHKFSNRIDVGASWIYNSGGTTTIAEQQTIVVDPDGNVSQENYVSSRNNYRLPASHRLNAGINFNKKTKHGIRTWNISVYNVYNAMNPTFVFTKRRDQKLELYPNPDGNFTAVPTEGRTVLKKITPLPCIPSVTYTYRF